MSNQPSNSFLHSFENANSGELEKILERDDNSSGNDLKIMRKMIKLPSMKTPKDSKIEGVIAES